MQKDGSSNMLQGPILKNIIFYTVPIMLTGILQLLFNAADLIVVGRFCGSISVAAVGASGALTNLIVNLFVGISVGAGVTVAHAIGAGDRQATHRAVHTALPTAIVSGIIITLVGVLFSGDFLKMMGTPDDVLPLSTVYMRIYFAGALFLMVYNFSAAILRAAGDTKSPLILLALSGVINVVLNVIFITIFDMNVAGVALATAISQAVSAILVVITLMRREDACKLYFSKMRFHLTQFKKMISIGLPAGIQSSLFSISNVLIQSSVNSFGSVVMSGNAAGNNIESFVYISLNAFHQTALNFIGQNVGARQFDRAKKIFRTCMGCVLVIGIVLSAAMILAGNMLLSIYITDSAEAIHWGMVRLIYMGIPYFLLGLMDTTTGALRGLGASVTPMIISVLGVCGIRIGWIYTIFQVPGFHTLECLYLSYAVSWAATFIAEYIAFSIVSAKKKRETA